MEDMKKYFNDCLVIDKWENIVLRIQADDVNSIEKLKDFDFDQLNDGDPDNTWLTRSILFCIYKDLVPNLKGVSQIGTGRDYRGDTMNSFNTLFRWWRDEENDDQTVLGDNKRLVRNRLKNVLGYASYCDFCNKIEEFYHTYHQLGNFILLPNKSIGRDTLNTYRGKSNHLQDFFDLFLHQLKMKNEIGKCTESGIEEFFNLDFYRQYFKEFEGLQCFYNYCKSNFLEMYLDSELKDIFYYDITKSNYFSKSKSRSAYQWRILKLESFSNDEVREYYEASKQYIELATERIKERSEKMIQKLKKNLLNTENL